MFSIETAIYSIIYSAVSSVTLDRIQSIDGNFIKRL